MKSTTNTFLFLCCFCVGIFFYSVQAQTITGNVTDESGGAVKAADFDDDGDLDLFIGNRIQPWDYPNPPSSYVLENVGGAFKVHEPSREVFSNLGMVTDGIWIDYNKDQFLDLIIVGEWMPVTFVKNEEGHFSIDNERIERLNLKGWWFSIDQGDFDNDGDQDIILGNIGENYKYKASKKEPLELFYTDFDSNGSKDIVITYYNYGIKYPLRGFSCSSDQIPSLTKRIGSYSKFASQSFDEIYGSNAIRKALQLEANTFKSQILIDGGNGFYHKKELPVETQFSSINDIIADDIDKDGYMDLLMVGNFYSSEVETPRNDAGVGLFLKGKGDGEFEFQSATKSGFFAPMDAKKIKMIQSKEGKVILVGNNNSMLQFIKVNN